LIRPRRNYDFRSLKRHGQFHRDAKRLPGIQLSVGDQRFGEAGMLDGDRIVAGLQIVDQEISGIAGDGLAAHRLVQRLDRHRSARDHRARVILHCPADASECGLCVCAPSAGEKQQRKEQQFAPGMPPGMDIV
jgi:hypothetical protein